MDPVSDKMLQPAELCVELLAALDVSEGRRRRRQRDTTPDAIGLGIKRALLERAIADAPAPEAFEGWLLDRCLEGGATVSVGAMRAMALEILHEWRLAAADASFSRLARLGRAHRAGVGGWSASGGAQRLRVPTIVGLRGRGGLGGAAPQELAAQAMEEAVGPRKLRGEDGQAGRNHHDRGARQDDHDDTDREDETAGDPDHDPSNLFQHRLSCSPAKMSQLRGGMRALRALIGAAPACRGARRG
jgi:hypothetical protein